MKISHGAASCLETIVRGIVKCDRYGICGLVDADIYESNPIEAAVMSVAFLYKRSVGDDVEDKVAAFFRKWRIVFDHPDDNQEYTEGMYIEELKSIIDLLKGN